MAKSKNQEAYLQNKIGLVNAMIAGHCIGLTFIAQEKGAKGFDYHYDMGEKVRKQVEKDMQDLYRYAFNQGRKSLLTNPN